MIIFSIHKHLNLKKKIIFVLPRFMYVAIIEIIIYLTDLPRNIFKPLAVAKQNP